MQYPIAIYKDPNGFSVIIPDIPTLTAQGADMVEAIATARQVVFNHLLDLMQQDAPVPKPLPVSEHLSNSRFAGYVWAVVSIELSRLLGDVVELNIRLPAKIIAHLHQHYPNEDINQIILDALKHYLVK